MIEIIHLKKSFDGRPVLRDINLNIDKGRTTVIIGRSGCGKTVLLKHIVGLLKPDDGEIYVDGEEVTRMKTKDLYRIRKKIGVLFQGSALFDSLTVEENVALGLRRHTKLSEIEIKKKVREKLEMVGLRGFETLRPAELSGGMKKRVGLARALVTDPEFVLFDEPTTGLDPIMADIICEMIINCSKNFSVTSVVVTHDMTSAYKVADRIAMIQRGVILFDGTPEELRGTEDPVVRQFIEGRAHGPIKAM